MDEDSGSDLEKCVSQHSTSLSGGSMVDGLPLALHVWRISGDWERQAFCWVLGGWERQSLCPAGLRGLEAPSSVIGGLGIHSGAPWRF